MFSQMMPAGSEVREAEGVPRPSSLPSGAAEEGPRQGGQSLGGLAETCPGWLSPGAAEGVVSRGAEGSRSRSTEGTMPGDSEGSSA